MSKRLRKLQKIAFITVFTLILLGLGSISQAEAAWQYRGGSAVNSTGSNNLSINKPAGTVQGDLVVVIQNAGQSTATPGTVDSGWTQISTGGLVTACCQIYAYYRIAGASEPSSYAFSFANNSTTAQGLAIATFYNDSGGTISLDTADSTDLTTQTTTHTAPSITTTVNDTLLVGMYTADSASATTKTFTTSDLTEHVDQSSGFLGTMIASSVQVSAGATGTKTATVLNQDRGRAYLAAFKNSLPPSVTTSAASGVTASTATLNSSVNPNGLSTTITYRYGTSNVACGSLPSTVSYGNIGSGSTNVSPNSQVIAVSSNTTYYFCATATNSVRTTNGSVLNFTTSASTPTLTSPTEANITVNSATLGANVTSQGGSAITSRGVCYALTSQDSSPGFTTATGSTPEANVTCTTTTGTTGVFTVPITGLTPNSAYTYRGFARNTQGNAYSATDSFTTLSDEPQSVSTATQTNLESYRVTLNGQANPNGYTTYGHFRVFSANPGNCSTDSGGDRYPLETINDINIGSSTSVQNFSFTIPLNSSSFLVPNTTYWYCSYAEGGSEGNSTIGSSGLQSFTTPDGPANPCDPPTSGNLTILSGSVCTFDGNYGGVDIGSGNQNSATLTLGSNVSMVINAGQRIAFGSLIPGVGAQFVMAQGATFVGGGIFVHDKDSDGILDSKTQYIGSTASAATEFRRRNEVSSIYNYAWKMASLSGQLLDCNSNSQYGYRMVGGLVTDADNDGYKTSAGASTQCVGDSSTINGRTYYKDASNNNTYLPDAQKLSATADCNDSSAAPCTPNIGTVTATGQTQMNVPWSAAVGPAATSYNLQWCSGASCTPSTTISGVTSTYAHTGRSCGTTYRYRVIAVNASGSSTASSIASGTTGSCVSPPNTPTNPAVANQGNQKINRVTWTASSGSPTGYYVYWCSGASCTPSTQINVGNVTTYDHTALTCGTTYGYRVTAYNAGGESSPTATVYDTITAGSNVTCYADADNDTYTTSSPTSSVHCGSCTTTNFESSIDNPADCDDSNNNVRPNQTSYFTSPYGGSNFDYNCNGSVEKQAYLCSGGSGSGYILDGVGCNLYHGIPYGSCNYSSVAGTCGDVVNTGVSAGGYLYQDIFCSNTLGFMLDSGTAPIECR